VGAEDGVGSINPAWDLEDRNSSFEWSQDMVDYNLQNLRVVQVELLDPVQCMTITENVDSVIWCATDFNGNKPRAVASLNVAFLFRAVADPTKGRVEIEGLRNILGGLKNNKTSKRWNYPTSVVGSDDSSKTSPSSASSSSISGLDRPNDPVSFVLVSSSEVSFDNFETPYGSFHGLKRDGERIVMEEFPSISHTVLRMSRYEDNFVEEGLKIEVTEGSSPSSLLRQNDDTVDSIDVDESKKKSRKRINRRDAAQATVDALTTQSLKGKASDVWTEMR
jgi:hypothetical protein